MNPAKNPDHYAIVIGLAQYPRLGPPSANLLGPERDADAVYKWLTEEGGVPPTNVKRVCSRDYKAPPKAAPSRDILEKTFLWLDELAEGNEQQGKGRRVGRRLYIYVSGHGFSPRFRQGCLLAGDAAERQFSANIFPTAWIDWLQDADYFREFVLWMDCCMDRNVLTQPSPPPLLPLSKGNAPGASFIAFAAPRPLKAIETEIPEDDGQYHGVFTWNLLQGLRGAAANSFGIVTGRSLADWLRQSQLAWLDGSDRINPDVAKEPSIVDENDALIFTRGVAPAPIDVTLKFPASCTDTKGQLWSGTPPAPGAPFAIGAEGVQLSLVPGLYLADVPAAGVRQGFAVTRQCEIELTETGEAAKQRAGLFDLVIDPGDPIAEIRLIADGFRTIDTDTGVLRARLPYGLYQMRIRIGRQIVEKAILLDSDWPRAAAVGQASVDVMPQMPEITSAAPLPATRTTHEYHADAVRAAQTRIDVDLGGESRLIAMSRVFTSSGAPQPAEKPWEGVTIRDVSGKVIVDLEASGVRIQQDDPAAICSIRLAPGAYEISYPVGDKCVAQSLIVPPGAWSMEVYVLRTITKPDTKERPRVSLLMRRIGEPWGVTEDERVEKARVALADERAILNDELADMLIVKYDNPLAGIIGGHLLLIDEEVHARGRLALLNTIVRNLRGIVGTQHPDVEALSLACPDQTLRTSGPIIAPPLFERSWRMLVKASRENLQLLPLELWKRVQATVTLPPYLMWSTDVGMQGEVLASLAHSVFDRATAGAVASPPFVAPAVPANAPAAPENAPAAPENAPAAHSVMRAPTPEPTFDLAASPANESSVTLDPLVSNVIQALGARHAGIASALNVASGLWQDLSVQAASSPSEKAASAARIVDVATRAVQRADELGLPRIALELLRDHLNPRK